jgi:GT2 family glycosyltransferase
MSVVVVNYNAGAHLRAALDSLWRARRDAVEVIVVDNGSTDDSLANLPGPVRVLRTGRNLGFARACNLGIAESAGERILLLNPDCRLREGAVRALASALDGDAGAGMAGPRLVNADGSEQRGARRDIPSPWTIFCELVRLHRLMPDHPRFRSFNREREPLPPGPVPVPAISGACMLVRRDAVAGLGLLDERFFLHFEDLDWCLRFTKAGWRVLFVPGAVVEHAQGVCSASAPILAEREKHRSLIRFLGKHFTAYYPSSFMMLVAALVAARFALRLPRLLVATRRRPRRVALGEAEARPR